MKNSPETSPRNAEADLLLILAELFPDEKFDGYMVRARALNFDAERQTLEQHRQLRAALDTLGLLAPDPSVRGKMQTDKRIQDWLVQTAGHYLPGRQPGLVLVRVGDEGWHRVVMVDEASRARIAPAQRRHL